MSVHSKVNVVKALIDTGHKGPYARCHTLSTVERAPRSDRYPCMPGLKPYARCHREISVRRVLPWGRWLRECDALVNAIDSSFPLQAT